MSALPLDVPFLPDPAYADFLATNADQLSALHFSLHLPDGNDGRTVHKAIPANELARLLGHVSGPRKYALLNARFHAPRHFRDGLGPTLNALETLLAAGQLHGVVVADAHLLAALSAAAPSLCERLEVVPSANVQLRDGTALRAWLRMLAETAFASPGKIIADRSLNRDFAGLKTFRTAVRNALPQAAVILLANEGCLPLCPHKPAHDALISHANIVGSDENFALCREIGCLRRLFTRPENVFASPIIRPEDAAHYVGLADTLKICGRTRGPAFLRQAISAYRAGRFTGNLLDLTDTLEAAAHRILVPNHELPHDFLNSVQGCDLDCARCGVCEALARDHLTLLGPTL